MAQRKDVFLVIDEDEPDWWEEAYLVTADTVVWLPVSSQSILSAQFVDMQDAQTIYIELFDITHMGNGFYYLFAFTGKTLTPLLTTRAVDRHMENMGSGIDSSLILKNDKLDCSTQSPITLTTKTDNVQIRQFVNSSIKCRYREGRKGGKLREEIQMISSDFVELFKFQKKI